MFLVVLIKKKKKKSRLEIFPGSPGSDFTMLYSQILDKKPIVGIFGSKVIFAFCVAHFAIYLLFSSYFDHSIQKQPKADEHIIIPLKMKIHSKHFWPKIAITTLLALFFGFWTFLYFASGRIRPRSLELVKNSQKVFWWSKSNNEFTFNRKNLKIIFLAQFKYHFYIYYYII